MSADLQCQIIMAQREQPSASATTVCIFHFNKLNAGKALKKIVASSENVMDTVHRIAAATEEQSAASEEVSQTMENTAAVISQTFSMADNIDKVADELVNVATKLKTQIEGFKTYANSSNSGTGEQPHEEDVSSKVEASPA